MAEKRPAPNEGGQPTKKHRFNGSSNTAKRHGQGVDETYGQRFAFGNLEGTTVPNDEDLEWEDEGDALAYLKSVRQQAEGIPHVLIAKKAGPELPTNKDGTIDRSIYADGRGDFRGFYHDGAYTAYPDGYDEEEDEDYWEDGEGEQVNREVAGDDTSEIKSEESSLGGPRNSNSAEIHEAYYITLTQRFLALRGILQSDPPDKALAALPPNHPTDVGGFGTSPSPFKEWSTRLRNTDPMPAQIASMHKDSVLRLLRIILNGRFFRRGQELRERTSRWIWALLARLPEKGEMDYQEIGWVRELGKRAVMFMLSLAEADVLQEQFGVDGSAGSEHGGDVEVERAIDEEPSTQESDEGESIPGAHLGGSSIGNGLARSGTEDNQPPPKAEKTDAPLEETSEAADAVPSSPSDVAMQIDSDEEDGEVSTKPQSLEESPADIETAKARLLAQLEHQYEDRTEAPQTADNAGTTSKTASGETATDQDDNANRDQVNMRATLNMILLVAGEFYGQRDLLEFRDPFGRAMEG